MVVLQCIKYHIYSTSILKSNVLCKKNLIILSNGNTVEKKWNLNGYSTAFLVDKKLYHSKLVDVKCIL